MINPGKLSKADIVAWVRNPASDMFREHILQEVNNIMQCKLMKGGDPNLSYENRFLEFVEYQAKAKGMLEVLELLQEWSGLETAEREQ